MPRSASLKIPRSRTDVDEMMASVPILSADRGRYCRRAVVHHAEQPSIQLNTVGLHPAIDVVNADRRSDRSLMAGGLLEPYN